MKQGTEELKGWISLHRRIKAHWLWNEPRKYSKYEAWTDMLMTANWERKWWTKGNRWVERGHYIDSELQMVRRWGWARKTVQRFLKRLEDEEMIKRIPFDKQYTEIEIVNFDNYQDKERLQDVEVYKNVDKLKPHESKDEGTSVVKDVVITNKSNKTIKDIREMRLPEFLNLLVETRRQNSPMTMKQYGKNAIIKARQSFEGAVMEGVDRQKLYEAVQDNPELEPWNIVKKAKQASIPQPQFARAGDDW